MQVQENGLLPRLPRMAISAAAGLGLTLLVAWVAALLLAQGILGGESAAAAAAVSCAAGTLAAGFFAARPAARQILPVGLITGGFYIILLLIIGALFFPGTLPTGGVVPICAASLAGACAGAVGAGVVPKRR